MPIADYPSKEDMQDDRISYKKRVFTSILFIIAGYFCYSITDLSNKILSEHYSAYQILTINGLEGLILCALWTAVKFGPRAFFPEEIGLHLLRGVFIAGLSFFVVLALKTLPLADFYGIAFTMPFMVMILATIFLKERAGLHRWLAAAVGFCGILILAGPQYGHFGTGLFYALGVPVCSALNTITLRKMKKKHPLPLYGFFPFLVITIFNFVMMAASNTYMPFQMGDAKWFLINGPLVVAGLIFLSLGFSRAPKAAMVAPFQYTQIIWGVLFGWIVFGDFPVMTTWIGLSIIIGAGLYSVWRENTDAKKIDAAVHA
jgi:drug/metabolite transporter (DMT)-like permease